MNKKVLGIITIAIVLVVILFLGVAASLGIFTNNTPSTNTTQAKTNASAEDISAVLTGPSSASQGKDITLNWKITNNGDTTLTNIRLVDQENEFTIDSLAPGETKTLTAKVYIPTTQQLEEDFGEGATISNPFEIGGFSVSWTVNGKQFNTQSNAISIPLN